MVAPLAQKDAVSLATLLMEAAAVKADPEQIAEASGGSPLLLIELVRVAALDPFVRFPRSLAEAINRRIGQLPPKARMVLHAMCVLGRPTTPNTLVTMLAAKQTETPTLNILAEQGFLTVGDRGWRPAHRAYREVAYSSIPVAVRSILHLEAAKLAIQSGTHPSSIAYHLFEGGNHGGAVPYLLLAGVAALEALDDALAAQLFNRVLRVIPGPPRKFEESTRAWLSATLGLASALADGHDLESALQVLRTAAQGAEQAGWLEERTRCERKRDRLRQRLQGQSDGRGSVPPEELEPSALAAATTDPAATPDRSKPDGD